MTTYPDEFLTLVRSIKNKRAKIVIDHILEYGFITTQEIETLYGYNHPPRAARDVREQGIPLTTFRIKSSDGRTIAAYRFGDLSQVRAGFIEGRQTFGKAFREELFNQQSGQCAVCNDKFEPRYLQIDHRIPYEIAGEPDPLTRHIGDYMLLCGVCNRAKSWSCEHCPNWQGRDKNVCQSCYWASPTNYLHVATHQERRTDIRWSASELPLYNRLYDEAVAHNLSLSDYIKYLLAHFKQNE